ncbi:MAG: hypothetical protein RI935_446 [Candidatus Parcubacteria bacterium]
MVSRIFESLPPLFVPLSKKISGEITCLPQVKDMYAKNNSPYYIQPTCIVYPKSSSDIKAVLHFAKEYSMPVTVRGLGASTLGGSLGDGIIVDMSRYFNSIRHINMLDQVVTFDTGITTRTLIEQLDNIGYEIPTLLGEETTSFGGLFATRSASPYSFFHGSIRDWVTEVTVMLDNGEEHVIGEGIAPSGRLLAIYQQLFKRLGEESPHLRAFNANQGEDATGYYVWNTSIGPRQLIDQLCGSEGTLAIVTSFKCRIIQKRPHTVVSYLPLLEHEIESAVAIAKKHGAEGLFLYDEAYMELIKRYRPGLSPLFLNAEYCLIAIHKDFNKKKLHDRVALFHSQLPLDELSIKADSDIERADTIMSYSFVHSLFNEYSKGSLVTLSSFEGLVTKPHTIQAVIKTLTQELETKGYVSSVTGYVGSSHIGCTVLVDPFSDTYKETFVALHSTLFTIISPLVSGVSIHSGDGITKTPFIEQIYNERMFNFFKEIKSIWDPGFILNPGKKTTITLAYIQKYLHAKVKTNYRP